MNPTDLSFGHRLRGWRGRRRMSQMELALDAEISTRHLSFLETGRSRPSRAMVLALAERLDLPLRERNVMLVAAGFAPLSPERPLGDPSLDAARRAVGLLLAAHEPFPALALDRHWTMVAHNAAVPPLLEGVDAALLRPPVNVLRLSLHPDGLAPRIANLPEWRHHLLERLRRQVELSADPVLGALEAELAGYAAPVSDRPVPRDALGGIAVPFRLVIGGRILSFLSTTTVFGTPLDVTLSELALETFLPADPETLAALRG